MTVIPWLNDIIAGRKYEGCRDHNIPDSGIEQLIHEPASVFQQQMSKQQCKAHTENQLHSRRHNTGIGSVFCWMYPCVYSDGVIRHKR